MKPGESAILGTGWVTALGRGDEAHTRLQAGDCGRIEPVDHGFSREFWKFTPDPALYADARRIPRLRRSSRISHMAVTAARDAVEAAGLEISADWAVVLTVSSGGVLYTRRFFEGIVTADASHASPLLFPETVYNAPASHIAAALGIHGPSYTLTGDSAIGFSGLAFAAQLLACGEAETVLVIGAEECDAVLCEAYHTWGLVRQGKEWKADGNGAILGEGAAALLLGQEGPNRLTAAHAPQTTALAPTPLWVSGSNGSAVADWPVEADTVYAPKFQFGESLGAAALMQVIAATGWMQRNLVGTALATAVGWNQEAGWARLQSAD